MAVMPQIGKVVLTGKFLVSAKIGGGSEGVTYKLESINQAKDDDSGQFKVGKLLYDSFDFRSPAPASAHSHEADMLRMLKHRNVVRLIDQLADDHGTWIITEFCDGGDLLGLITEKQNKQLNFSKNEIVNIFIQIMQGVRYLHAMRIVHRDIKPSNIFLSAGIVKLGDFGIARPFRPKELMQTFLGTPCYMSPELLAKQGYTQSTDIWSCGCILFELCCLEPPFTGASVMSLVHEITDGTRKKPSLGACYDGTFDEPYRRLVCVNPEERISAGDFLNNFFLQSHKNASRTVLLTGVTGVGKSSLGNLIAGEKVFEASDGLSSCTRDHLTHYCNDTGITIIDTMGMADPNETQANITRKIMEALEVSKDGVDVIFFVLKKERITEEKYNAFKELVKTLGDDCQNNLCMAFTYSGDDYVCGENERQLLARQQRLIDDCKKEGGRTGEMFEEMLDACNERVIFVENPPKTVIKRREESNEELREICRRKLVEFILASDFEKFTPEAAVRAQEQQRCRDETIRGIQEGILRKLSFNQNSPSDAEIDLLISGKTDNKASGDDESQRQLLLLRDRYYRQRNNRLWLHEKYCARKECAIWSALLKKNRNGLLSLFRKDVVDVRTVWAIHRISCAQCFSCQNCTLEDELDKIISDDVRMAAKIAANQFDDVKSIEEELNKLHNKEWARFDGECNIL